MKKNFGIIYKATNKINGKSYIGQTIQRLSHRKADHLRAAFKHMDTSMRFYMALRKYGRDAFEWEILERCDAPNVLDDREIYYIRLFDAINNGYNTVIGGKVLRGKNHPSYGTVLSQEVKQKLSKALSGANNPMYGKTHTSEACKKISLSRKKYVGEKHPRYGKPGYFAGKKRPDFSGINHPYFGKNRDKEVCEKISNGKSQKWLLYCPNGDVLIVKNIEAFCKLHKLNSSHLYATAKKKRKHSKGYRCKKIYTDIIICKEKI